MSLESRRLVVKWRRHVVVLALSLAGVIALRLYMTRSLGAIDAAFLEASGLESEAGTRVNKPVVGSTVEIDAAKTNAVETSSSRDDVSM